MYLRLLRVFSVITFEPQEFLILYVHLFDEFELVRRPSVCNRYLMENLSDLRVTFFVEQKPRALKDAKICKRKSGEPYHRE